MPLPENATLAVVTPLDDFHPLPPRVDPVAVTLIDPFVEVVVCAINITLMGMLCPALSLIGKTRPGVVKLSPLRLTWVMVSAVSPELDSDTDLVCEAPSVTGPNVKLAGLAVRLRTLDVLAAASPLRLVRAAAAKKAREDRDGAAFTAPLKMRMEMRSAIVANRFGRASRTFNL